jgi:hypothetical protein
LLALAFPAVAQDDRKKKDGGTVELEYDEPAPEEPDALRYAPPIEELLSNPALAGGIESGSEALNKSVESLMDSLFYSLLDNEKNIYVTNDSWVGLGLDRHVYSTPSGAYVVTDRFRLGPNYFKELWRAHNVPVMLGIDGRVDVLQIYIRTDGQRLAEQEDLSPLRRMVNNWFGLLPLAARVLPPSFNQNELYDPVKQLGTPFSFPFDADGFYDMPVGSLKSYLVSGGVRLPVDFGGAIDAPSRDLINESLGFSHALPYTVFRRGEYRINVLRQSDNIAWVGVKKTDKTGHSINPFVGSQFNVLRGALAGKLFDWKWVWAGVPIAVIPLDVNYEQAGAKVFDQVYEFQLLNQAARDAYTKAVQGDFEPAYLRYLDAREKGEHTGVAFHFARSQDRDELNSRNGPNVAVAKTQRQRDLHSAEVEITDPDGKYYILEATQDVADKKWDILVGEEEVRVIQTAELKVSKVLGSPEEAEPVADNGELVGPQRPKLKSPYRFEAVDDPYALDISMSVQDRYVDTDEYDQYLQLVQFVSGVEVGDAPVFERTDKQRRLAAMRRNYFVSPRDSIRHLHTPATHLGRFGAQLSMHIPYKQVRKIIESSPDLIWAKVGEAFGEKDNPWSIPEFRDAFTTKLKWYKAFFLYPLRLFNLRIPRVDLIKEGTQIAQAIERMRTVTDPLELMESFHQLFDTDYPLHLSRVLVQLCDPEAVSKRVVFSAQPKGPGGQQVKSSYGKLNNMVIREGPTFPPAGRYAASKAKLANFYLDRPREEKDRPRISKIQVVTKSIPESVRSLENAPAKKGQRLDRGDRHVFLSVAVANARADRPIKLYIRIEQAGRLKIGKLELIEEVLELAPAGSEGEALDTLTYDLFLTGPLSPLSGYVYDQMVVDGGEFNVTIAVSNEGRIWSDEKSLEFRFEKGRLLPIK